MLHNVKGALALMLAVTNVLVMAVPFFSTVILKVLLPGAAIEGADAADALAVAIADAHLAG